MNGEAPGAWIAIKPRPMIWWQALQAAFRSPRRYSSAAAASSTASA